MIDPDQERVERSSVVWHGIVQAKSMGTQHDNDVLAWSGTWVLARGAARSPKLISFHCVADSPVLSGSTSTA